MAIAYIRVSTDEQNLGPVAQAEALRVWSEREGITILETFTDHGISGAAPVSKRPGLLAALAALKTRGAGLLVASARSRLARDSEHTSVTIIENEARNAGAQVRTADGASDGKGSTGVLTKGMSDLVAAWERAVISERTKSALLVKKARNELTGKAPFGFRVAEDGVHLEPDPTEQGIIERVLTLRAEGKSERGIVNELALDGVAGRSGRMLQQPQVHRILVAARAAQGSRAA
jgi:DNA invertase Pin-like site-specific DNA recombinase